MARCRPTLETEQALVEPCASFPSWAVGAFELGCRREDPERMARPLLLALCLLALGGVTAGCGTDADRDDARRATKALYAAAARHDGAGACAQMSAGLRAELVSDEGERCAKGVLSLDLHGRTPDRVEVYANEALVRLAGGDMVFLSATREGWRVDALGCRPHGKGPYDCEATS